MDKQGMIREIQAAHRAHMAWVSRAAGLIEGLDITEESCPLHATDCKFGSWYYTHGQLLLDMPEFQAIEDPHMRLHQVYMQIFKLVSGTHEEADDTRSFFQRLIGKPAPKRDNSQDLQKARDLFRVLQKHSSDVVKNLHALQHRLEETPDIFFQQAC